MIRLSFANYDGLQLNIGRVSEWLLRIVLTRLLRLIDDARSKLPITFHFQVRSIRGRIIIDDF